jgi:hypothetical protein
MREELEASIGEQVNIVPITTLPYRGELVDVGDDYLVVNTGHNVTVALSHVVAFWRVR